MPRQRWWIRNWLVTQLMFSWVQLQVRINASDEGIYAILFVTLNPWTSSVLFLWHSDDPDIKMVCFSSIEFSPTHWSHSKPTCRLKDLTVEFWDPCGLCLINYWTVIEADEERRSEIDWEVSCPKGFTGSAFILVLLTGLSEILIVPIIVYTIHWLN